MEMNSVSIDRQRKVFNAFNRFMLLLWRLGLATWGNGTRYGGFIMVIKHRGRKSGLLRYAPVNYASIGDDVYCTAGFGARSDWYRNLMANPQVELWLADGRWAGVAEDATDCPDRVAILRRVLIASGLAGPLLGVNPANLSDDDLAEMLAVYRLVRIRKTHPLTGPGGPGDLAWVWPVATFVLLGLLLRQDRPARLQLPRHPRNTWR